MRSLRGYLPVLSRFLFILAFLSGPLSVYAGTLDPTFGTGGKFTIAFPDSTTFYKSFGQKIFYQPGDRIIAAGRFTNNGPDGQAPGVALVGLTLTGTVDPNFFAPQDWGPVTFTGLQDIIMLPDGKLLRLSQVLSLGQFPNGKVVQSNANGSADATFSASVNVGTTNTIPLQVERLPSGKLMVLVFAQTSPESHRFYRLNPNGSRDTTFGVNGEKLLNVNRLPGLWVYTMTSLPNGKTIIAGSLNDQFQNSSEFFLARFDADGNLDGSFGRFGIVRYSFGTGSTGYVNDMIVDANGRYTVVGAITNTDQDTFMMRFTHRGRPDATFGVRGVAITDITPGGKDLLNGVTQDGNGKLIVAGEAAPTAGAPGNFLLARFSEGGAMEAHTKTEFTPGQFAAGQHVTIQPDGKILVIGSTYNPNTVVQSSSMWAIARYTSITND